MYHKHQLKLKTTEKLKVDLQTVLLEQLPQEHISKSVVNNFTKRLTLPVWLPVAVTSSICNNSLRLQLLRLHLHLSTNKLASQSHKQTTGEDNARNSLVLSYLHWLPRISGLSDDSIYKFTINIDIETV